MPARVPRACWTSKYATASASMASFLAVWISIFRAQHLALRQRSVDRVGQRENRLSPAAGEELISRPNDWGGGQGVQPAAVVALVVETEIHRRQPQDLACW